MLKKYLILLLRTKKKIIKEGLSIDSFISQGFADNNKYNPQTLTPENDAKYNKIVLQKLKELSTAPSWNLGNGGGQIKSGKGVLEFAQIYGQKPYFGFVDKVDIDRAAQTWKENVPYYTNKENVGTIGYFDVSLANPSGHKMFFKNADEAAKFLAYAKTKYGEIANQVTSPEMLLQPAITGQPDAQPVA